MTMIKLKIICSEHKIWRDKHDHLGASCFSVHTIKHRKHQQSDRKPVKDRFPIVNHCQEYIKWEKQSKVKAIYIMKCKHFQKPGSWMGSPQPGSCTLLAAKPKQHGYYQYLNYMLHYVTQMWHPGIWCPPIGSAPAQVTQCSSTWLPKAPTPGSASSSVLLGSQWEGPSSTAPSLLPLKHDHVLRCWPLTTTLHFLICSSLQCWHGASFESSTNRDIQNGKWNSPNGRRTNWERANAGLHSEKWKPKAGSNLHLATKLLGWPWDSHYLSASPTVLCPFPIRLLGSVFSSSGSELRKHPNIQFTKVENQHCESDLKTNGSQSVWKLKHRRYGREC